MSSDAEMVPKVHPATREMLPDDPLSLQAFEVPGDPAVMLRFIVEEYARMGTDVDGIMQLARDPFYQALHGLWLYYGEQQMSEQVAAIVRRCGALRIRTVERTIEKVEQLVQISLPASS